MARYNHYFPAFSGGELSPQMLGRSDTDLYKTSAETIDNFIVQIQGGVTRRPGFKYIADALVGTTTRLIPFYHSSGSEYMLEFSNLKFRIFKNGVIQGAPTQVTTVFTTAQIPDLDFAQSGDEMYIVHESHPPQTITRTSDTAWAIAAVDFDCAPMYPLDDATYGRTDTLGNTARKVSSLSNNTLGGSGTLTMNGALFSSADVGKFIRIKNFTSDPVSEANATVDTNTTSVDVKVHDGTAWSNNYDGTFAGTGITLHARPSYVDHGADPNIYTKFPATSTTTRTTGYSTIVTTVARTYTPSSSSSASDTISYNGASSTSGDYYAVREGYSQSRITDTYDGYVTSDETITVTGNEKETWGLVEITGYTSSTSVTVTVRRPLSSTNFHSTQKWQMSRFGSNTGYPKAVAFNESRVLFGNLGPGSANVLVASKTNSITDFENGEGEDGTLTAATALDYTLSEIEAIQWLQPAQRMLVGAANGVYSLSGSSEAGINPLDVPQFRLITDARASTVKPVFFQGTTFFSHTSSTKLGGIVFKRGEFSGFDFEDMTKFSSHLTLDGISEMGVAGDVVWIIDTNGDLSGVTYNEENKLVAWHQHSNTDVYNSIQTVGKDLYIAITRANGQTIEVLGPDIQNLAKEDVICVDSALTYDGSAATVITGLNHLEGETVDILADGAVHPQQVVASNQITLDYAASVVQVGLPYTSTLKTTEAVGGNRRGSSESRSTRVHEIGVKLLATNGACLKTGDSNNHDIIFKGDGTYGSGPDLFTGTKVERVNSGTTINPTVTVTSVSALPISILGISVDTNVSET